MFRSIINKFKTMAKKKSPEKSTPKLVSEKFSFAESNDGHYPSALQVQKFGLDKEKKYILTKI